MASTIFRMGLALKFILLTTLLIIVTSLTLGLFFLRSKEKDYAEYLKNKGIALSRNLSYNCEFGLLVNDTQALEKLLESLIKEPDVSYSVVHDKSGKVIAGLYQKVDLTIPSEIKINATRKMDTGDSHIQKFKIQKDSMTYYDIATEVMTHRLIKKREQTLLFPGYLGIIEQIKRHLRLEGQVLIEKIGTVRVGISLANLDSAIANMKKTIGLLTLGVAFLGILITIVLVQLIIRPIRRLVYGTRQIARGDLNYTVKVKSRDEIGELSNSFNKMTLFLRKSSEQLEEYSKNLEKMVTERTEKLKATELELIRAEKFAAIGELVTGITHELNNKLTPILGYIQIFKTMKIDPLIAKPLDVIEESAINAKKIVESLLKFSRTAPPEKEYINLNEVMNETIELTDPHRKKINVELAVNLAPNLPRTMADRALIGQTFLNILNNALQAMDENGGLLTIQSLEQERKIIFTISDTGGGIPESIMTKIFDPFFTTKAVGKGTGLGLSMCYGIMQKHNGSIHVRNEENGATFIIEFPIKTAQSTTIIKSSKHSNKFKRISASILLMEDEENIQSLIKDILKPHHEVSIVNNGNDAINILKENRYDIYLMDIRLPKIDGIDIYHWMEKNYPHETRKVIFITGDTYDKKTNIFLNQVDRPRITKPFQVDLLKKIIMQVIEDMS